MAATPPTAPDSRGIERDCRAPLWLGLVLTIVSTALVACGGGENAPVDVSLEKLATQENAYKGKLVRTRGVVRTFESPRHFWIEDDYPNRVALEPDELVVPLVGREVRVVGRFDFDDRKGRVIEIDEIAPSAPGPGVGSDTTEQLRPED